MLARDAIQALQGQRLENASPLQLYHFMRHRFGAFDFRTASQTTGGQAYLDFRAVGALDIVTLGFGCDTLVSPSTNQAWFDFQWVLDGCCTWRTRNQELVLQPGDAALINQQEHSQLKIHYNDQCRKVIIRIPADQLHADAISFGYCVPPEGLRFALASRSLDRTSPLAHIIRALTQEHPASASTVLEEHYRRILNHLILSTFKHNLSYFHLLRPHTNPLIEQIRQYIIENPSERVTPDHFATQCKVSKKTIYNLFEREMGITPSSYITRVRLELAHLALTNKNGARNITEVAVGFGFTNTGRFSRQYRDYFGQLPSQTLRQVLI